MGTLVVFGALGLARFGYSIVLPSMQAGLGLDNTQAGALATANLIGYLALSAIGGALAVRFGPRTVASLGLAIVGVGMLLTGLANSFPTAAVWRALTGIGSGAANISVMGMLSAWFTTRKRGFASGIVVGGSSIALILLGPFVPRILSSYGDIGWRICWYIFGGVALLLAVCTFLLLHNQPNDVNQQPYGAEADAPSSTSQRGNLAWGRVYRARPVWHLGMVYAAFGFSYIIYMTFFVKRLTAEGGYTQEGAGRLFMTMGWLSLFCGLIWGTISDMIGRKRAMIIVYLIQSVAFGTFAIWPMPIGFTLSAILFGLTAWSIPAIMAAACGDVLGSRLAPAALGFITLFFGIGQAVAPSIAGAIADATGSFAPAFLLAAGVAALGAVGAALLQPASTISNEPTP